MSTQLLGFEAFSQSLPCAVEPEAIRAYSLAYSNSICLVWPANDYRQLLRVARRIYTNRPSLWQSWTEIFAITNNAVAAAQASQYCDTNVTTGVYYEYRISAVITNWLCGGTTNGPYAAYQYISTGIEAPLKDQHGKLVLLVESNLAAPLVAEIARLQNDLIGDGYQIFRHDVAAADVLGQAWKTNVTNTKALIRADYNTDTNADWTIFIVGHVPIPYSGDYSPGSHTENLGAHPADWYYADMDESAWTDTTVSDTTSLEPNCWNVPGDGKFDQNYLPTPSEMRIGRVDLVNMPAFGKNEVELMRQYLDRDHAWRTKQFSARDRALIIPAAIPYEMHSVYSSFFGSVTNCDLGLWLTAATNSANTYLFAASKGSASYTDDHQLGDTTNFAATPLYAVFTTMFGSYYGDWDSATHTNVVLKAPLCTEGYVVSTYYHDNTLNIDSSCMVEPIGQELYAMGASAFSSSTKRYDQYGQVQPDGRIFVINEKVKAYTTLMGDPTLRVRVVAPPTNVTVSIDAGDNVISWTPAEDTNIEGYHVYRAPATNLNGFVRITSIPVTAATLRDPNTAAGAYRYMVRTVKLEESPNRSYYNISEGALAAPPPDPTSRLTATLDPRGGCTLVISGEPGRQYTIENSTDASKPMAWHPVTNITLSSATGTVSLADTNPVVFYRLRN